MVQFYFLSILFNLFGGLSLFLSTAHVHGEALNGLRAFLRDSTVCLVLGILTAVTGAFKLLTVMRGDIPVVGDFLPAAAGIAVGGTLLLERFRDPESPHKLERRQGGASKEAVSGEAVAPSDEVPSKFELLFLDHKSAVGLAGIIASAVHFLFPMVLFL
jgi:purine-cytosine permease-like protein